MTIPGTSERQTFYHWVLVDIPANVRSLKEGADSNARVVHGKTTPTAVGAHGLNMYTVAFAANDAMRANIWAMMDRARRGMTRRSITIISSSTP